MELLIDSVTRYAVMFFMDGYASYNSIRMGPEDEEAAAFKTSLGIYCYKVMLFGLKNARATYQRAMQKYTITYKPTKAVKGQTVADFLAAHLVTKNETVSNDFPDEQVTLLRIAVHQSITDDENAKIRLKELDLLDEKRLAA
ncbi:uncharacterized protein LOC131225685 [Magnolia sinica]|uniref:uncharacterized protein LOC131225685 n=1 Tax=Magnolia sinica TaxID=86752 RepID=UPI00265B17EC|nr:uncharacterized protein LOC131225685 [Magnolia sinica]